MIGDLFVFYVVIIYFFFACFPFTAYIFGFVQPRKAPGNTEAIEPVLHAVLLVGGEVALGIA